MTKITKAGVIGAGVMGSGIAAHLANAGIEVVLLDIEKKFADGGVARQLKANGFMDKSFAGRITTGSTGDDMGLLADADWIVEAVAERLEIKQALYKAIDAVRKPGSIVSSNTSTIPLAAFSYTTFESFAYFGFSALIFPFRSAIFASASLIGGSFSWTSWSFPCSKRFSFLPSLPPSFLPSFLPFLSFQGTRRSRACGCTRTACAATWRRRWGLCRTCSRAASPAWPS